jgi:ubiquinone/menaquinone biosynthesis C-methylase UbiE
MNSYTYEESVHWMRSQPEHAELVELCYLDKDNLAAAKRFAESEEFCEVANILKPKHAYQEMKVLDLGCGNGVASYAFASLGWDVTAVDPDLSSDVGLKAAERLAKVVRNGSISVINAFAESLPFPDSTFDIIYARQALHHFSNLQQGLVECSRVLKGNYSLPENMWSAMNNNV